MLEKETAKRVLQQCVATGADFAEIFYEDTYEGTVTMLSGTVDSSSTKQLHGAGIRILLGFQEAYGYTTDTTEEGLTTLAKQLRQAYNEEVKVNDFELVEEDATKVGIVKIDRESKDVEVSEKIGYLRICDEAMRGYDKRIVQTEVTLTDKTQHVTIANTNGKFIHDIRNQQRIRAAAISQDGNLKQMNSDTTGGNMGIDTYKERDLKAFGLSVATAAINMLYAEPMVPGVYSVVIHNGFGGVLFHEACGHSLEATSCAKGMSVFSNKYGQRIASDVVTAIDDGTVYNEWGSLNCDDDGNPTKKNYLITNGMLTSYMIDDRNSRRMNMASTGNSRRESYRFSPTSRMTNTYIANGESTFEEIIAATEYGLFCKQMGGGSVNTATGEFNFAVNEGYMIEHGKITRPVKGATLIGNGANALLNIDMVANNASFGHGMCGSASGSVPANVGEPTIRIQNMTVGGSGGKK